VKPPVFFFFFFFFFFFSISMLLSRITYYVSIVHLKSGRLTVFQISDFSN
jgi:hypothetical protein